MALDKTGSAMALECIFVEEARTLLALMAAISRPPSASSQSSVGPTGKPDGHCS